MKGIALDHNVTMLSAAFWGRLSRLSLYLWHCPLGGYLYLPQVSKKKKKKEPWCCPDLWVILMAVRDIGCLFPRSPEGGRQGGVCAAGSFICDGKSPCHIDGWLGVASAATRALYQTTVPQRRAEPGGRVFSIYESINIQTLTYGHEIWVVTVRIRLLKRDFSWESLLDSVWGEMAGSSDIQGKKKKSKSNRRPTPARRLGWVSD